MHFSSINNSESLTTLQILTKNKSLLSPSLSTRNTVHLKKASLLPPMKTIGQIYLQSSHLEYGRKFKQLNVFASKLQPNPALSFGEDYEEYQLMKIVQICLRKLKEPIENKEKDSEDWAKLQKRITEILIHPSSIQNIQLFFISVHKFSLFLQQKLLKMIQEQAKFMLPMQKQLLFYSLCQLKDKMKGSQIEGRVNQVKQGLVQLIHRSKLPIQSVIQWTILASILHLCPLSTFDNYLDKLYLYPNYKLTGGHLYALMASLNYRAILQAQYVQERLRKRGKELMMLWRRGEMQQQQEQQNEGVRLKMLISYVEGEKGVLSNEEIMSEGLNLEDKLEYLMWLWKNQGKQQYEIKSLYESLQLDSYSSELKKYNNERFQNIELVYWICWLQMGLGFFQNHLTVSKIVQNYEYVPRGLEFGLWSYFYLLAKSEKFKDLDSEVKLSIQKTIQKMKNVQKFRNTDNLIQNQVKRLKKSERIAEMGKFFSSIRAWTFKPYETVLPIQYLADFVSEELQIIIKCLQEENFIERKQNEKVLNQQFSLQNRLLNQVFGYSVINIEVEQFLKMQYSERIQFLQQKIQKTKKISKKITQI